MRFEDLMVILSGSQSTEDLFCSLLRVSHAHGFEYVAYKMSRFTADESSDLLSSIHVNYPRDWQEHYIGNKYYLLDPIFLETETRDEPFEWLSLLRSGNYNRMQMRVLGEAEDFGLRSGVSVPIHGSGGRVAFISFASKTSRRLSDRDLAFLNILATHFNYNFNKVDKKPRGRNHDRFGLSARERECLSWVLQGKSSRDIGQIINLSQNTVTFHVKNAMRKIGTSSRNVAAAIASQAGVL